MTPKAVWFFIIVMFVQLAVIAYVFISDHNSRVNVVDAQRAGCERSKLDRKDSADFQNAHVAYINKVTNAKSVKEDVKRAARKAVETFERTSAGLTSRSKINCKKAFPEPEIFP